MNVRLHTPLDVKETVDGMEKSFQHMSDNYDVTLKRVGEQDEEIKGLKKWVTNLEKTNADAEIDHLKQKVHDLEWRNRRQNLELHEIPVSENEDLLFKINEVANNLDVPDLQSD